jgi:serine/threonine-protein phosphatase 2A regulatory subunit A
MSAIIESDDLYQIALLIDQLKHDDIQLRVNASKNLLQIAQALGPERTRDELIPFLSELTDDDDDEVLHTIAENLGELCSCVGGDEYVHRLLSPLELLATVEESAVREKAINSIEIVARNMPEEHLLKYYSPFVVRLSTKDWFTSRISAVALFHPVYNRLPESEKSTFRLLFVRLCADDTPIVRRIAAQYLSELAKLCKPNEVLQEFLPVFTNLANDEQDSVRIQTITNCVALAEILPIETKISQILPAVLSIANDKSWRVRWSLANKLKGVCQAIGEQSTNNSLVGSFENLLTDSEAEVLFFFFYYYLLLLLFIITIIIIIVRFVLQLQVMYLPYVV